MMKPTKTFEAVFDLLYLAIAYTVGLLLLCIPHTQPKVRLLAGIMALVLAVGDSFHLIPRIMTIIGPSTLDHSRSLGRGKQIASITMTLFYVMLWYVGLMTLPTPVAQVWTICIFALAGIRIILCLLPANGWLTANPSRSLAIWRNIPFILEGALVAAMFFVHRAQMHSMSWMWLAIIISFACYLPVAFFADRKPMLGMLMLPKSVAYLWMLMMTLAIR